MGRLLPVFQHQVDLLNHKNILTGRNLDKILDDGKLWGQKRDNLEEGGAKLILLEGPRFFPAHPYNMSSMNMEILKF